jgi:hypothetical protein
MAVFVLIDYLIGAGVVKFNPISNFLGSLFFVGVGAYVAPYGHKTVAIILATIKVILPIVIIILALITLTADSIEWYDWLNTLAAIAGAIVSAYFVNNNA